MNKSLTSIQCLRAVAAFGVVLSHLSLFETKYEIGPSIFPKFLEQGSCGVDLFFVISGFIITLISLNSFGVPNQASRFLWKRFIRIYPIYWVYFAIILAVFLLRPGMVNSGHAPPNVITSFLLLPSASTPLILVAWTLVYEIFFYAVFACLLKWSQPKYFTRTLCLWAAFTTIGNLLLHANSPVISVIFSPLILEFLMGCVAAVMFRKISAQMDGYLVSAGLVMMLSGAFAFSHWAIPLTEWSRVFLFGIGASLLVCGFAAWETNNARQMPKFFVWFGAASYSLYLSHILVIAMVGSVWRSVLAAPSTANHLAAMIAAILIACIGGCMSFRFIETPILAFMQNLPKQIRLASI